MKCKIGVRQIRKLGKYPLVVIDFAEFLKKRSEKGENGKKINHVLHLYYYIIFIGK